MSSRSLGVSIEDLQSVFPGLDLDGLVAGQHAFPGQENRQTVEAALDGQAGLLGIFQILRARPAGGGRAQPTRDPPRHAASSGSAGV